MKMSKKGERIFDKMQELYEQADLGPEDGICCASDFFVWATMAVFANKEACKAQMRGLFPTMLEQVDVNWDGLVARRQVVAALDAGESGGRLQ